MLNIPRQNPLKYGFRGIEIRTYVYTIPIHYALVFSILVSHSMLLITHVYLQQSDLHFNYDNTYETETPRVQRRVRPIRSNSYLTIIIVTYIAIHICN